MGELLEDRVAVVTGSGQGIGRSIAIGLASEGAKVVTNNRRPGSTGHPLVTDNVLRSLSPEQREWLRKAEEESNGDAETTAQTIKNLGGEAIPFFGDVSDFAVAGKLIQTAVDTFGKIDILVNVAGTFGFSSIWEMPEEMWDRVTLVKPKSHFNCIRHASPFMIKQGWGRIINCTSRSYLGDVIKHAQYCAANAGVVGLTRAVGRELYRYGITCNAFAPFARTRASYELTAYDMAMSESESPFLDRKRAPVLENTPDPDDLAPFITFLASDAAGNISATVFYVGGSSIGIYSEPVLSRTITKSDGKWTVNDLISQLPRTLFAGYQNPAVNS
ncbi:MAG: SDR family oxidoreductase [Deltaproteobacteria bacterium]|nr:SDR family oxidoreductase [Deltaproteobacteria bacterium]